MTPRLFGIALIVLTGLNACQAAVAAAALEVQGRTGGMHLLVLAATALRHQLLEALFIEAAAAQVVVTTPPTAIMG
jgi:hypothetical protein